MERFYHLFESQKVLCAVGGLAVTGLCIVIAKRMLKRKKKVQYPRNTVVLHQLGRGPYAPSLSPYVMKLETYLRIANIPYQVDHELTRSSKGKWPWIEYNDECIADSEFCMDFLNKKFNVDLDKSLSTYERGVATAIRVMVDEHLAFCMAMFRYTFDPECLLMKKFFGMNRFTVWVSMRYIKKAFYLIGIGRHNKEEVTLLLERELQAIADVLGQKKFLMGDSPCRADSAVFGQLSQFHWHCVGNEAETILKDKFPTLAAYCERIKSTYWPDWDDCTTRGFTTRATR